LLLQVVKMLQNVSYPRGPTKFFGPWKGTGIPKAQLLFENVTAHLSNRPAFIGYSLDTRVLRRQNIGCFALIEAERQVLISQLFPTEIRTWSVRARIFRLPAPRRA
jgi:hypothetical protein